MSGPRLPPEIIYSIVDLLHDNSNALRECSLVSKLWIPLARKHLFANITFHSAEKLESWKTMFPDPSASPAHYAKYLIIQPSNIVPVADAEADGWIRGFCNVEELEVVDITYFGESEVSLLPFHGFSPVVKSLRFGFVVVPSSRIFDLILSFPLLEDLSVAAYDRVIDNDSNHPLTVVHNSGPPRLTGSLELHLREGLEHISRRLLSLPGGIHFRKLDLTWFHERDASLTMDLVERCSHVLESLDITCTPSGTSIRRRRSHKY